MIVTNNDDAYRTALTLLDAGLEVPAIVDARQTADGPLPQAVRARGVPVRTGMAVVKVKGAKRVTGVGIGPVNGLAMASDTIACDAVAMSGGWSPVVHLWSHCGGKLTWDDRHGMFRPDPSRAPTGADGRPFVTTAGAASGALLAEDCLPDAGRAGAAAAEAAGCRAEVRTFCHIEVR